MYTVCASGCDETTIQAVFANDLAPNDVIEVRAGSPGGTVTFREQITWGSDDDGTSGNNVVIQGRSGDTVIISGSDLTTGWSQYLATNIYSAACTVTTKQVLEDAVRLIEIEWDTDIATTAAAMSAGEWSLDDANNLLYVWATDNADPDTHTMLVATRQYGIDMDNNDYITITNLTFKESNRAGIYVGGDGHTISYNTFLWGTFNAIESEYAAEDAQQSVTIEHNTISWYGGNGILMTNGCANWTIQNNTIFRNGQTESVPLGANNYHTHNAGIYIYSDAYINGPHIVQYNIVYEQGLQPGDSYKTTNTGHGIWSDTQGNTYADKVTIRYNKVYSGVKNGIFLEKVWYNDVYYNIVYDNQWHGIRGDGTQGAGNSTFGENKIYNNTIYENGQADQSSHGEIYIQGGDGGVNDSCVNNVVKNNIMNRAVGLVFGMGDGCQNDDTQGYGNIYLNNSMGAERANFIIFNGYKSTYDTWETAYGGTTSSVESDPLMTDPATDDFTLQSNSPAIDAGVDVGLTEDYFGMPIRGLPDIGFYEYQPATRPGSGVIILGDPGGIEIIN